MKLPKPIKPFKTLEEEAHFWDTHHLSPLYKNPKSPLSKLPLIETEKKETLVIRLQKTLKQKLSKAAQSRGLNPSTLARMWLAEKLQTNP